LFEGDAVKVAVKDACVLIDLANGGLLAAWFELGIETHTTDLVLRQVKAERHWPLISGLVADGRLKVATLTGEEMERLLRELGGLPVGLEDQTALFLALELEATLLTGDRRLRLEGLKRRVQVHGVLWILDLLVARKVVAPRLAAEGLRLMLEAGAFLPADECEQRLRVWEGGGP
jgi:predicted nucleic acid-binding protein